MPRAINIQQQRKTTNYRKNCRDRSRCIYLFDPSICGYGSANKTCSSINIERLRRLASRRNGVKPGIGNTGLNVLPKAADARTCPLLLRYQTNVGAV